MMVTYLAEGSKLSFQGRRVTDAGCDLVVFHPRGFFHHEIHFQTADFAHVNLSAPPQQLQIHNILQSMADRLRLNLYLDVRRRAMTLLRLRLELDSQRRELEELLRKKARLDDAAGQEKQVDDAGRDGCAEDNGDSKEKKNKDIKRAYGYYNAFYDRRTCVMKSFELNVKKTDSCRLLAGYFASVTHRLDFGPMEAHHHYKLRDEQEKYFEQMKDQMAADRQRCWSEEGWTGRQFILFVSLILGSQVRHVWRTKLKDKFSSSLEILDEMRCIRCIEHPGHARKITPFVGAQLEICEAFGFEPSKGCDKIYTSIRKQERKPGRPRKKVVEVNND